MVADPSSVHDPSPVHSGRPLRWSLGVVHVTYGNDPAVAIATKAEWAKADGFTHIDAQHDTADDLVLPIVDRFSIRPRPDTSSGPWPNWSWEETVDAFTRAPGCRLEPWPNCVVNSDDAVRAICDEVPGLRLLLDCGHVGHWGGDPVALAHLAGHIQLRQARPGRAQARPTDGIVDFERLFARLDELDYRGSLSIEYFDLPQNPDWVLDDPRGHAVELAEHVRPMLIERRV